LATPILLANPTSKDQIIAEGVTLKSNLPAASDWCFCGIQSANFYSKVNILYIGRPSKENAGMMSSLR